MTIYLDKDWLILAPGGPGNPLGRLLVGHAPLDQTAACSGPYWPKRPAQKSRCRRSPGPKTRPPWRSSAARRDGYLWNRWPQTTFSFNAINEMSQELIREIAGVYYPEEERPELKASLADLVAMHNRVGCRLAAWLETAPIRPFKDVELQTVIRYYEMYQSVRDHPVSQFIRRHHLHKVAKWSWAAFNYSSPFYWGRQAAYELGRRLLLARLTDLVGEEAMRLYGRRGEKELIMAFCNQLKNSPGRGPGRPYGTGWTRHRRITLANLEFAYGAELTPEARERLAREVFGHFVRFALEVWNCSWPPCPISAGRWSSWGRSTWPPPWPRAGGPSPSRPTPATGNTPSWATACNTGPEVVVGRELDHPLGGRLARYLRERGGNCMVDKQRGLKEIMRHLQTKPRRWGSSSTRTPPRRRAAGGFFRPPGPHHPGGGPPGPAGGAGPAHPVPAPAGRPPPHGDFPAAAPDKTADAQADIQRHLELQSRVIEAWVRASPDQWLWLHRRWKNQFPEIYS